MSFTVHVGVSGRDSVVSWMLTIKNRDSDRYHKGDDFHMIMNDDHNNDDDHQNSDEDDRNNDNDDRSNDEDP